MKVLNEILASNQVTFFYRTYIYKIDYFIFWRRNIRVRVELVEAVQ